jgi:hypothetical protein
MDKKLNKVKDLIKVEEEGLKLTLRAMKDHPKDSSLHIMFGDQAKKIKKRIKQLKKGKNV